MNDQDKIAIRFSLKDEPTDTELDLLRKVVWDWTIEHALEPLVFVLEYNGKILHSYSNKKSWLGENSE